MPFGEEAMKRILVIDDDIHISDMIEEALTKEGYSILKAYSGAEALYVLSNTQPDLIPLDLMLPGLSGEELLSKIKDIPVIVTSERMMLTTRCGFCWTAGGLHNQAV